MEPDIVVVVVVAEVHGIVVAVEQLVVLNKRSAVRVVVEQVMGMNGRLVMGQSLAGVRELVGLG